MFHQKTERVEAHILVCFLTLALWRTLEMWMRGKGLGDWRPPTGQRGGDRAQHGRDPASPGERHASPGVRLRVVARPDRPVAELLVRLGLELPSAPKLVQNVVEKTAPGRPHSSDETKNPPHH